MLPRKYFPRFILIGLCFGGGACLFKPWNVLSLPSSKLNQHKTPIEQGESPLQDTSIESLRLDKTTGTDKLINDSGETILEAKNNERFICYAEGYTLRRSDINGQAKVDFIDTFGKTLKIDLTHNTQRLYLPHEQTLYGSGEQFISFPHDGECFSEGLAPIMSMENTSDSASRIRFGYIDTNGKIKIKPDLPMASKFNDGFAFILDQSKSQFYFINQKGEPIFSKFNYVGVATGGDPDPKKSEFDGVNPYGLRFSYNLAPIHINNSGTEGKGFTYINGTGEVAINERFEKVKHFSEGLALVRKKDGWKVIDTNGKEKFTLDSNLDIENTDLYFQWEGFKNGLMRVKNKNTNLFGYVDKTGQLVIDASYKQANHFRHDGTAQVYSGRAVLNFT